jgi:hypothetical protein
VRLGRAICLFGSVVAWPLAAFAQSITQPTIANLPKIEVVRVKPRSASANGQGVKRHWPQARRG